MKVSYIALAMVLLMGCVLSSARIAAADPSNSSRQSTGNAPNSRHSTGNAPPGSKTGDLANQSSLPESSMHGHGPARWRAYPYSAYTPYSPYAPGYYYAPGYGYPSPYYGYYYPSPYGYYPPGYYGGYVYPPVFLPTERFFGPQSVMRFMRGRP